jgi:transposase-like protein
VIVLAVRWYLRFGLSYRDVEELLAERGIDVDHVTVYRWVQRFTPLLAEAARPCRHVVGQRWFADETYVKVAGKWRYVYRAIDQFGQVIDVFVAPRRDVAAARRFFERAIATTMTVPVEVVTDRAPTYPVVLDELLPAAWHRTDRYATTTRSKLTTVASRRGCVRRAGSSRTTAPGCSSPGTACPERPPRPLRAGGRGAGESTSGRRVRRARLGDLTPDPGMRLHHAAGRADATAPARPSARAG